MLVIGHRGCAGLEPENTLRAFRRALELGADAIEMDVRLSCDHVPVVFHDDTLDRTTNGHGSVGKYTVAELQRFRTRSRDEQIPTLEEALKLIADSTHRIALIIELKEPGTPQPVVALLQRARLTDAATVISFNHNLLLETRRLCPAITVGALWNKPPRNAVSKARQLHASVIDVNFRYLRPKLVEDAHRAGLGVYVWTVNRLPDMQRMIRRGVDGITTNFPDRLRRLLERA